MLSIILLDVAAVDGGLATAVFGPEHLIGLSGLLNLPPVVLKSILKPSSTYVRLVVVAHLTFQLVLLLRQTLLISHLDIVPGLIGDTVDLVDVVHLY